MKRRIGPGTALLWRMVSSQGKKTAGSADEWLVQGPEPGRSDNIEDNARTKRAVGPETSQWLIPSTTDLNGRSEVHGEESGVSRSSLARTSAAEEAANEVTSKTRARGASRGSKKRQQTFDELHAENAELARRIRELQTDLRLQAKEAKGERDELARSFDEREAEMRQRIAELESVLAGAKKGGRAKAATSSRRRKSTATVDPSRKPTGSRRGVKTSGATSKVRKPRMRRGATRRNGKVDLNHATFEELRKLGLSVTQTARVIAYRDVRGGFESLDELDDIPGLPKDTRVDLRVRLTLSD
jgi:DNA uptake protein ComE-like DNA-binding protein